MPNGMHWEWRGFGPVDDTFREEFEKHPLKFQPPWDTTKDEYVWIPGSEINVKLRSGGQQQGLKLKRFVKKDDDLELWLEDPKELFPFSALDAPALQRLAQVLDIRLTTIPAPPPTQTKILETLRGASPSPSIVAIAKRRQTREPSKDIQIQLAEIVGVAMDDAPVPVKQPLFSVAIENGLDLTGADQKQVNAARDGVDALVNSLHLRGGGLRPMNYLHAIDEWLSASI